MSVLTNVGSKSINREFQTQPYRSFNNYQKQIDTNRTLENVLDPGVSGRLFSNESDRITLEEWRHSSDRNKIDGGKIFAKSITADSIEADTITASEIAAGTITATELIGSTLSALYADLGTITAGNITLDSSGFLRSSGKDNYADTTAGFFLGYDTDAYKFNIGSATKYLKWDGSGLTIRGTINADDLIAGTLPVDRIAATSIVIGKLNTDATDRMFTSSTKQSNVEAWIHSSDVTLIDGGKIYTNSVVVAGLNSDATNRMFTSSTEQGNIEAWIKSGDVTKIDGGDISTGTITANVVSTTELIANTSNIKNAIITTAKIGSQEVYQANIKNLAVDTAQIQSLAVETAKIAGQAVTIPVSAYYAPTSYIVSVTNVLSAGITSTGAPIQIIMSFREISDSSQMLTIECRRDGADIYTTTVWSSGSNNLIAFSLSDTPGSGGHTYYIRITPVGSNYVNIYNKSILLLETKK